MPRILRSLAGGIVVMASLVLAGCEPGDYQWQALPTPALAAPAYPLQLSANRRYLTDRNGAPFFLSGDAAWSLITGLTPEETETYLADRQRKGFNTLLVNLIEHKFNGPRTRDGVAPFLVAGDFATPNPRYFDHAEWVVRRAAAHGMAVLLAPCYLGAKDTDEGWYEEVLANGVGKCRDYARFVAQRFRDCDNIVWVMGGDRETGEALPHVRAMAEAIRTGAPGRLRTAHMEAEMSTRDALPDDPWVDFNLTYSYRRVSARVLADYYRTPVMPTLLIESNYDEEGGARAVVVRRQAFWAILNGGCGQVVGNTPLWRFGPGWRNALDSSAYRSMVHFRNLFLSLPWQDLVPDSSLLHDGQGNPEGFNLAAAARTPDRRQAIVYLPTSRAVTLDLSPMAASRNEIWWFDPRTGKKQRAHSVTSARLCLLRPPHPGDWVLLVQAS